ncbi:MAG TPA: alpha/beta hydrolase [Acidimicrobiia bacterium]|nr:alpha/beta hydrolase [Acidimicrobiia bacterium]
MRLWTDDVEAMRGEARTAVDSTLPAILELMGRGDDAPESGAFDRDEQVARARKAMEAVYLPSPDAVVREIAGVPCRVFTPDGPARAVYLHFHGGGMIIGAPEMGDPSNMVLCDRFGMAVVSVDYRLAPEHPYPAGPDDGVAVAEWLLEHAERELGSSRLLVGGESAGGYMSAVVLLRMRDELHAAHRVDGANLVFGVYDWGRSPSQRGIRPVPGPDLLDPVGIEFFSECYLPDMTDDERRDPSISPAFADLRDLPPALMSVGTSDHLVDDTLTLSARWAAAGNEVELAVLPEMPHGFMAVPCSMTHWWAKRTNRWFAEILGRPPRAEAV